ncbi:hypothetical protein [Anaeromyxobacter oryzae]|uniref:Uncharacterized protein n=1 Tax=Anaeromyxobacter oryzae TaxID=2918170 RepID=A0ABN6MQH4_9BACT|nr:hypothetical protein [Anaeromyxobacter oryzae]BDG02515.1 hypothetical protein AMOR_15110 [Anaeromyxobacter oryzae]
MQRIYAFAIAAGVLAVAGVAWLREDAHRAHRFWDAVLPTLRFVREELRGKSGDPQKPCWDPESTCYVSWKAGTYPASLAPGVTSAMIGDPKSSEIVVGKTKAQLRAKFGLDLITTEYESERGAYFRICREYEDVTFDRKYRRVLFVDSGSWPWMIVLGGDTATDLVLLKGC